MPIESDYRRYAYVTLHWQALEPMMQDYWVSIQLLGPDGERVAWRDAMLGSISYPEVGTSHWPVGARLKEGYLLNIPVDAPSVMDIYVNLYELDTEERLLLSGADGVVTAEDRVRIGRLGLKTGKIPDLEGEIASADFMLGDSLHVTGFKLPDVLVVADNLAVGLQIEARQQVYEDYILFFHLLDANGKVVAQSDSPTLIGYWTTAALIPSVPLGAERVIDLPDDLRAGEYQLMVGMYSYDSLERLSAHDSQGNTLPDGLIEAGWVNIR
jgi:hypothetical protein